MLQKSIKEKLLNTQSDDVEKENQEEKVIHKNEKQLLDLPKLEDELKHYQKHNMSPVDIYLEQCRQFAASNLKIERFQIEPYDVTGNDLKDKIFIELITSELKNEIQKDDIKQKIKAKNDKEDIDNDELEMSRESFDDDPETNRDYYLNDIDISKISGGQSDKSEVQIKQVNIDYEDELDMIEADVNSRFVNLELQILKDIIFVNGHSQMIVKTWEKKEQKLTGDICYIKTLRVFDHENNLEDSILVEQVWDNLNQTEFYDVSTLFFEDKLYYFKRINKKLDDLSPNDQNDEEQIFSYLQLFCYDFMEEQNREKPMEYIINEMIYEKGEIVDVQNLHVVFSNVFGCKQTPQSLQEFFDRVFLTTQKYIDKNDTSKSQCVQGEDLYSIYRIKDLNNPIYVENNQKLNGQLVIQFIFTMDIIFHEDQHCMIILITGKTHFHITFNKYKQSVDHICRYMGQPMTKRVDNPEIQVQKFNIKQSLTKNTQNRIMDMNDEVHHNKTSIREHYYFIDNKNQLSLLFPNYQDKQEIFKIKDLISEGIKFKDYEQTLYKKINFKQEDQFFENQRLIKTKQNQILKRNSFQEIKRLRKILNYENIGENQIIVFACTELDQILYITHEDSVICIQLKDHHCETTQKLKDKKLRKHISKEIQMSLKDLMHVRSPQSSQQRMSGDIDIIQGFTQKWNYLTHDEILNVDERCQQGQDTLNTLNIEINTQEIQVIKNDDLPEMSQKIVTPFMRDKYILLTDKNDRIHEIPFQSMLYQNDQDIIVCEMIQRSDNHYVFLMSISNYNKKKVLHKNFMIVTKTISEIESLFDTNPIKTRDLSQYCLVTDEDLVLMFSGPDKMEQIRFKEFKNFQMKNHIHIELEFEKYMNTNIVNNIVCIIYQQAQTIQENWLILYNIETKAIVKKVSINPTMQSLKYLYVDFRGFNSFKITSSSDFIQKDATHMFKRVQIFTNYVEKIGRIQCQEFNIELSTVDQSVDVQQIGQKQIMMSSKFIRRSDWNHLKNSLAIPFLDVNHNTTGCQLIIKQQEGTKVIINLQNEDQDNLYIYKSQIAYIGQKKFNVNIKDPTEFLIVVAARMKDDVIFSKIFDQQETFTILRGLQEIIFEMRRPDLEFLILYSFETQMKCDFFSPQQLLSGKSFCDISMSDPKSIKLALSYYNESSQGDINKSVLDELTKGDRNRQIALKDINFYPKNQLIQFDFNFNSTIERGLILQAHKSIKLLTQFILHMDRNNTNSYQNIIMLDLPEILSEKVIDIDEFFQKDANQTYQSEEQELKRISYHGIELELHDIRLQQFSKERAQFMKLKNFQNLHDISDELCDIIHARDKDKQINKDRDFQIEHTFIDFKYLILGQKFKYMRREVKGERIKFDDLFFANLVLEGYQDKEFFMQESVQKIIDLQYTESKVLMKSIFWFYVLFFCIPYSATLIRHEQEIHDLALKVCLIPQAILLIIELVQIKELGRSYFQGWNIIDLAQIFSFMVLFLLLLNNEMHNNGEENKYINPLKLFLLVMSIFKCLHFVQIYESFGFFISMVIYVINDLKPFFSSFFVFIMFFSCLYASMGTEIDEEITSGRELGYFGLIFLTVWRNSTGKLGFARYQVLMTSEHTLFRDSQVLAIQLIYFSQIMFMLVLMLNMIIAIIDSTYKQQIRYMQVEIYRNKACLNQENFQLMKYFKTLQEYRVLLFSTCLDDYDEVVVQISQKEEEQIEFIGIIRKHMKSITSDNIDALTKLDDYLANILSNQKQAIQKIRDDLERFEKGLFSFKNEVQKTLANQFTFRN